MSVPEATVPAYRRLDIQGLRAVAVLAVVAFHAGLPLPGGYTGVDVFFVISGFVITGLLLRHHSEHGRLHLARFYGRRFMRLIPALALMLSVVLLGAAYVLNPSGPILETAYTALGAITITANVVLTVINEDYFAAEAASNPLLNTWSLSVEEQFYLVFPAFLGIALAAAGSVRLLIVTLARVSVSPRAIVTVLVAGITAASFAIAINPALLGEYAFLGGFYGPLGRAWEFTAGALLALTITSLGRLTHRSGVLLSFMGVGLLAASMTVQAPTVPGWFTLLPVLAAVALIAAGTAAENGPVTRLLSVRPLTLVGDWSYSVYLWHWPVIVFAVLLYPTVWWLPFVAAVLSFAPATASYYFVENPLRYARLRAGKLAGLVAATFLVPAVLAFNALTVAEPIPAQPALPAGSTGLPGIPPLPSPQPVNENEPLLGDVTSYTFMNLISQFPECESETLWRAAPTYDDITRCRQTKAGAPIDVAIIGDSHAEHLFPGMAHQYPDSNIAYYVTSGLPPDVNDPLFRQIVDGVVNDPNIHTVIYSGSWTDYAIDVAALRQAIKALTGAGKVVYVTDDTPFFPFNAYDCKTSPSAISPRVCDVYAGDFLSMNENNRVQLNAAIDGVEGVRLLDTHKYFCDADVCRVNDGNVLLFRDTDHLGLYGTQWLAQRLARDNPDFDADMSKGGVGSQS